MWKCKKGFALAGFLHYNILELKDLLFVHSYFIDEETEVWRNCELPEVEGQSSLQSVQLGGTLIKSGKVLGRGSGSLRPNGVNSYSLGGLKRLSWGCISELAWGFEYRELIHSTFLKSLHTKTTVADGKGETKKEVMALGYFESLGCQPQKQ